MRAPLLVLGAPLFVLANSTVKPQQNESNLKHVSEANLKQRRLVAARLFLLGLGNVSLKGSRSIMGLKTRDPALDLAITSHDSLSQQSSQESCLCELL